MTIPATLTDHEILDRLAPLLVAAHEHGGRAVLDLRIADRDDPGFLPPELVRAIEHLLWHARRAGLTPRQIARHAHLPGRVVIRWLTDPGERAAAYTAELHHLDREAAEVRHLRAGDVAGLRVPAADGGAGWSKVDLAALHGVSRPTIDQWLSDATS